MFRNLRGMYVENDGQQVDFDIADKPEDRDTVCRFTLDGQLVGTARFGTLESWAYVGRFGGMSTLLTEFVTLTPYGKSLMTPADQDFWERHQNYLRTQRRWQTLTDDAEIVDYESPSTPEGDGIWGFVFALAVLALIAYIVFL
jgi:hypothetical protein